MTQLPPAVLPDTNFLIDYPAAHREKWLLSPLEILISETVIGELRGLEMSTDSTLARKAQVALQEIDKILGPLTGLTEIQYGVTAKRVERCTDQVRPLNPQKPDHQLIACARKLLHGTPPRFCAILSNDKELCDIAEALAVISISRQNEQRFHQELLRKQKWWELSKADEADSVAARRKKKPATQRRPRPGKQVLLNRSIKKLYRRIRAVGCRTTIYLAPLKARLALTLEVIQRLPHPEHQVVIVVIKNREAAHYWAGELRQMGGFTPNDVQIFGVDQIDRLEHARVVIYRHDQVARRLPQHVVRLAQAEKRITAIVDGCDLLDPVELAMLLYECDQFIGLNHLPLGYRQSRGHRMLSLVLHNRSLIDYSFADAERDRWGHSCDLYLHKVEFTPEERQQWDKANDGYIKRKEWAAENFPELAESANFWEDLTRLLDHSASPELAELIKLREERELSAQLAAVKLEQALHLVAPGHKQPYRCMIFDYARQWTPVLLKELAGKDVRAAELPEGEAQRKVWDQFSGNHLDVLLLSQLPAWELPAVPLRQLIILTPLRAMDEILGMIDWALEHNQSKEDLRLTLLYIDDTPEEIAMLELAEASFGLR